jgi:hypothetical protein
LAARITPLESNLRVDGTLAERRAGTASSAASAAGSIVAETATESFCTRDAWCVITPGCGERSDARKSSAPEAG